MTITKILYVYLWCTMFLASVKCQVFTSVTKLERLLKAETVLTGALEQYIEMKEITGRNGVSDHVKRFFAEQSKKQLTDAYVEHPTNAYQMINRFLNKWPRVLVEILQGKESPEAKEFRMKFNAVISKIYWPKTEDLNGALDGVLRLWDVYRLNTLDLFDGKISGVQGEKLEVEDILNLAKYAHKAWRFEEEIILLRKMFYRMKYLENETKAMVPVLRQLASAYHNITMNYKAIELLKPYIKYDEGLSQNYSYYLSHSNNSFMNSRQGPLQRDRDSNYKALCRGNLKTDKELAELKCFHRKSLIPIYRVKEEVVNVEPRISLFHDVISETGIALMKKHAKKNFVASKIMGDKSKPTFDVRISETSWLNHSYPISDVLNTHIGIITGLDTTPRKRHSSVEKFQIVNYGLGGMYEPHSDCLGFTLVGPASDASGSGERIATWMYYLSDVPKGGVTVFPQLKARIPPIKGAAAFWYNVKRSGMKDVRMEHAGCPVLLGSKWGKIR